MADVMLTSEQDDDGITLIHMRDRMDRDNLFMLPDDQEN